MRLVKLPMGIFYSVPNTIGVLIRKVEHLPNGVIRKVSKSSMEKQMITVFKKVKRAIPNTTIEFVVEKDNNGYHSHLIVNGCSDPDKLKSLLQKFIGGNKWTRKREWKRELFNDYECCYGNYGEIELHQLYDTKGYRGYLNKTGMTRVLV